MISVFADTFYWVASITPGDPWHERTLGAVAALGQDYQIITIEEVLVEVLSAYSGQGSFLRGEAARAVRAAIANAHVTVLPQTHQSFLAGLALYENRADKGYSLVDCISMNTMRELGLNSILTNDHHFTQEGFTILIHR
ncbi:MAG TPA: PIN domain-containing protein [Chthonomonadaceae bacterium]|nr:PIN domain-containing protein [Chthonomonadaceae bacterium]